MTRFPADATCLCSLTNISVTVYRISTEFKLPVSCIGQYAWSMSIVAGYVERGKIFLVYPGHKNAYLSFGCVGESNSCHVLFPTMPATSLKW